MDPERDWVHRTASLRGLSYRFAVRSDDEHLGRQIDALFAGLRDPEVAAPADHWYSLTTTPASAGTVTVDVWRDGVSVALGQRPPDALGWVVWDVNRATAEASGNHLLLHAGALDASGAGVLVPGASGSGKSTLVAGLARAGLGYLTDELTALDLASGKLLPYAKPITIKPGSFAVLGDMAPDATGLTGNDPREDVWARQEWLVAVGEGTGRHIGGPCDPGVVIVPRFDAGAETRLSPLSDTEAFFALALHTVNLVQHGAVGTAALGELVARCACFALTMSGLDEACRLVHGLLGETVLPVPRGGGGHDR